MKNVILVVALTFGFSLVSLSASAGPRGKIQRTQKRQMARIGQGVRSGELNGPETRRLVRQQARIGHMRKKANEDGQLTVGEVARIRNQQRKANRRIYRQKHDGQKRENNSQE
ncbi:MAG: hypothetical protein H6624_16030 [Bdellovibrionaceae bacterium]|nr:hypothetical protein [Bdellovibrionales bacterium]MCB9085857.1 hypothetical protein [Pseudobdellovibrionaceae bacterium]